LKRDSLSQSRDLTLFFVIAFGWSWLFWLPDLLASTGTLKLPDLLRSIFSGIGVFGPTVAAFGLTYIRQGKSGVRQLWRHGWDLHFKKIWLLPTLVLIPIIGVVTAIVLSVFKQNVAWEYSVPPIMIAPVIIMIYFLNALPEEYGWRGFALDRLQQRWNALTSSLILGVLWGLWHLPLHFISGTTQAVIPIWEFVLQTVVLTVLYTWLNNNTGGSVLVAILFHTMSDITGAVIPFWTTETGRWISFVILLVIAVIVIWVWKPKRLTRVE
jgi:membrane protease YdiL (CAAX protease family)